MLNSNWYFVKENRSFFKGKPVNFFSVKLFYQMKCKYLQIFIVIALIFIISLSSLCMANLACFQSTSHLLFHGD